MSVIAHRRTLAYRIRFDCETEREREKEREGASYLSQLSESLANISRSEQLSTLEPVCPCITDISVRSISRYKGREGLPSAIPGMARRWQTLCKASERRLSAPFSAFKRRRRIMPLLRHPNIRIRTSLCIFYTVYQPLVFK